ncbi:MAG: methyltransferase domain-containing protein [Pyrinomonadaceae bacterium]|jgi:ubiquinone/menaquinone biosynthesis C-methylase UbiE|nr:methyltransferase domain-containing protein [Pyrinomonadaceae bacterium]
MFQNRSYKLERLDTGDYTKSEYDVCLSELRLINRWIGDTYALKATLLKEIKAQNLQDFSVLDVGAGSGELLREIAKFARKEEREVKLFGLEYNELSAKSILAESTNFKEISAIRGDGFSLPFADKSFDYTICSLFTHHFTDENVVKILAEMKRVSSRGIYVIDLHRHPIAYGLYKAFCVAFRISNLVREDGSLSVLRGFKPNELNNLAEQAKLENIEISRHTPYRLVLKGK